MMKMEPRFRGDDDAPTGETASRPCMSRPYMSRPCNDIVTRRAPLYRCFQYGSSREESITPFDVELWIKLPSVR